MERRIPAVRQRLVSIGQEVEISRRNLSNVANVLRQINRTPPLVRSEKVERELTSIKQQLQSKPARV